MVESKIQVGVSEILTCSAIGHGESEWFDSLSLVSIEASRNTKSIADTRKNLRPAGGLNISQDLELDSKI